MSYYAKLLQANRSNHRLARAYARMLIAGSPAPYGDHRERIVSYRGNDPDEVSDDEAEELRAEDNDRRERHAAWMKNPDPRDPDHPDEEDEE